MVRNYMRGRNKYEAQSHHEAQSTPFGVTIACALLLVAVAVAFFVWRHTRSRGPRYEELESVQLTRVDETEDAHEERTPSRPAAPPDAPAGPLVEASDGGGSDVAKPAPAPPIMYGPFELRRHRGQAGGDNAQCWQTLHPSTYEVRGANYMRDGKMVPSDEGSSLLAVELFRAKDTVYDVAARPEAPTASLASRASEHPIRSALVVNLVIPAVDGVYQLVLYFGIWAGDEESGHAALLDRFCTGSDAFRNARFKILPSVAEGSWLVKKGVGSTPAITGKTLKQRFHRGEGYFEVDIDCNSSPSAGRVVSLVKSYAKSLVVDLAFVVEAQASAELPERVLGCGRLSRIDLDEGLIPSIDE